MEPLTAEDLAAPPFGEFYKEGQYWEVQSIGLTLRDTKA